MSDQQPTEASKEPQGGTEYKPNPIMHDQHDAMLMSMSAIALMASHPYLYWKACLELAGDARLPEDSRKMYRESAARCEKQMRRVCELLDEVMQYIGDCNNAVDAVDDYGMTHAAFAAMDRALGRAQPEEPEEDKPN